MKDQSGTKLKQISFPTRVGHEWKTLTTDDYFKNKKVAVFALPGAFTPTCSSTHLPRYNELYDTFIANGFDDVICLSVNDTFVMNQWQEDQNAQNITMLPDGNGELTESLGYLVDKAELGFGKRSWRYSMIVNDGVIEKMYIETEKPGDPFSVSDADTMLNDLGIEIPKSYTIYTREGCEFCVKAKQLLQEKGIKYEEHILNKDYSIKSLKAVSGDTKVPQVFADGVRIGGYDSLKEELK